jgi:hypothetical protein
MVFNGIGHANAAMTEPFGANIQENTCFCVKTGLRSLF